MGRWYKDKSPTKHTIEMNCDMNVGNYGMEVTIRMITNHTIELNCDMNVSIGPMGVIT